MVWFCLFTTGVKRLFFILKSLWGPSYFAAKRLLSSRSSVFPISTMTGSTFPCPGKWNYQLASCTGCSGPASEDHSAILWVPGGILFTTTTLDLDGKQKNKAVSPNHLVCSPFHLEILWSCAIRFYFQKIQFCFFLHEGNIMVPHALSSVNKTIKGKRKYHIWLA